MEEKAAFIIQVNSMDRPAYRILVAEDEEIARRSLCLLCARSGSPVEVVSEANTGRQVLEELERARPDIILMDVVMPGMSGLTAAKAVRERSPAIKIVMISAYEVFSYAQEALRAGAVDYLLKPVRPEQLEALLKKLCADLDAARAQETSLPALPEQTNALLANGPHTHILKPALAFIAAHYTQQLTLEQVAEQVALSSTYFSRIFKQETGSTFIEYLTRLRLEEVKRLLRTTRLSLAEISYAVGYQNPNYLSERFKALEGMTPSAYRRNLNGGTW